MDGEHRVDLPGGQLVLDLRIEQLTDGHGRAIGRVIVARDVTELVGLRDHLAERAVRDELTGLYNRRHLMDELDRQLAGSARQGAELSVLMVDVDHFKSVNDRHGHAVGDALLTLIARALTDGVRSGDVVARIGGEEFVVLLPGTSQDEARARAEHVRHCCGAATVPGADGEVRRTVSVGLATLSGVAGADRDRAVVGPAALLRAADEALYRAKASGRDRVVVA